MTDKRSGPDDATAKPRRSSPDLGRSSRFRAGRVRSPSSGSGEDLAVGDPPVGVLWHLETAQLLSVLLPAIDREPLFSLKEEPASEGFPLVAVYGEQGPQVAGWLDRYEPRWAEGLHLLEAIVRSPWALATLLEAAGPGAEEQVGRIRARRQTA